MARNLFVGLDIGTSSVKIAALRPLQEEGVFEVAGFVEEPSRGVRKGVVANPEEAGKTVALARSRLESLLGEKVDEAAVSIGGSHLYVTSSRGVVAVSRADQQISQEDVDRVLQAAKALSLDSNKEVLDIFPKAFVVDGGERIKEAAGLRGVRLEAEVTAVCGFTPYIKNLASAVLGADMEILDMVPAPAAAAETALTPQQKELGAALVDIGAGTTSVAVYEEGELVHAAVFPVGSDNITHDIAIGLRCEPETAERIKKEYGAAGSLKGRKTEKVEAEGGETVSFTAKTLSHIIEARVKEILGLVRKELKKAGKDGDLPAGVVFSGGGANIPKLPEFAKKELRLSSKVGSSRRVGGAEPNPAFLVAMGLAMLVAEAAGEVVPRRPSSGLGRKVKEFFRVFVP